MKTPEQWRQWLQGFTRQPESVIQAALTAVDSYENLLTGPSDEAPAINAIVQAASSPRKLVFETGCKILFGLAKSSPSCQRAAKQMSCALNATARFHAVAFLNFPHPEQLKRIVINRALADRSARVKCKAIAQAETFRLQDYLPQLQAMLKSEKNKQVVRSLEFHIPLLQDGFRLRLLADGKGYDLTVRGQKSIIGTIIPKELYSESYVKQTIEHLKEREIIL